jgi:lactoylglutathione lyase
MQPRAFPVVYAHHVDTTARFYERLGFERHFQLPPDDEPGYVGMRRGSSELAVVAREWPSDRYDIEAGDAPTFEMFVYVDDADATIEQLAGAGVTVVRAAADMPWGERVGCVLDPDGTPVSIATAAVPTN